MVTVRSPPTRSGARVFTVHCIWKRPEERNLITDHNEAVGGTWYARQTHTNVATSIVEIGVSRTRPFFDADGIPHLKSPEGAPTSPLTTTQNHFVELNPLRPGNHYFFLVLVTDTFGNWDFEEAELTDAPAKAHRRLSHDAHLQRRRSGSVRRGRVLVRAYSGSPPQPQIIEEFHLPTQDVDDWGETDRPYSIGIAHAGGFEVVDPGEERCRSARGASSTTERSRTTNKRGPSTPCCRSLPVDSWKRSPTRTFFMDCPTATVGDDFHFGVDVKWSVDYAP